MYSTDFPSKVDLPTTDRLIRSTIAGVSALAILPTILLPSEYSNGDRDDRD